MMMNLGKIDYQYIHYHNIDIQNCIHYHIIDIQSCIHYRIIEIKSDFSWLLNLIMNILYITFIHTKIIILSDHVYL